MRASPRRVSRGIDAVDLGEEQVRDPMARRETLELYALTISRRRWFVSVWRIWLNPSQPRLPVIECGNTRTAMIRSHASGGR